MVDVENPVSDDFAYSRRAETDAAGVAARTVHLEDNCVLMLHPAEHPVMYTPLTVTCVANKSKRARSGTLSTVKVSP